LVLVAVTLQTILGLHRWPHPSQEDKKVALEIQRTLESTHGEVLALVNDQQAFSAGKRWYTSGDAILLLNMAGIQDFSEIENKLADTTFRKVIVMGIDYDGKTFKPEAINQYLHNNYRIEKEFNSVYVFHPAYLLTPR
jgi:hypothetical protein